MSEMQPAAKGSDVEMTAITFSPDGGHGEMRDFSDLSMDDVSLCSAKLKTLIEDKTYFEPKADTQLWTSRLSYTLAAVGIRHHILTHRINVIISYRIA